MGGMGSKGEDLSEKRLNQKKSMIRLILTKDKKRIAREGLNSHSTYDKLT